MCEECESRGLSRRVFLGGAAAALAGTVARGEGRRPGASALGDPRVHYEETSFTSGGVRISAFLARPKRKGRFLPVLLGHGNPGISEDIRNATAQVAQAGFVGLAVDWGSRAPVPIDDADRPAWLARITSHTFVRSQMSDLEAGLAHLASLEFVRKGRAAMIGFCGGGRLALLFASESPALAAVVSFYGPVVYRMNQHPTDPVPNVVDVVPRIGAAVQGHYGLLDTVAPADDARHFERAMKAAGKRVEMYYYARAGHRFYNLTVPEGSDPGFDYNAEAAALAHRRMARFLKARLR
jgi:carboxymethylenebutenolidase